MPIAKFVQRCLLFALGFLVLIGSWTLLLHHQLSRRLQYRIPPAFHTVIAGNSRPECAVMNDSAAGIFNVAGSGEHPAYTLAKLNTLFAQNPQIRRLVLEVNELHFESGYANTFWGDEYITNKFPVWFPKMKAADLTTLIRQKPEQAVKGLGSFLAKGSGRWLLGQVKMNKYGGYKALNRVYKPAATQVVLTTKTSGEKQGDKRWVTAEALERIAQLCDAKNIQLVLLHSPVHPSRPAGRVPMAKAVASLPLLAARPLLDYGQTKLCDTCFADEHHLNIYGAKAFTPLLVQDLASIKGFKK